MERSFIKLAAGSAAALMLMGAAALPANASYLGYANGDPGNWDFWTEQHGGPITKAEAPAKPVRHAHVHSQHHAAQKQSG